MFRKMKAGSTSQSIPLFVQDTSSSTGAGLGALVFNTAGLTAKYRRKGDSAWTAITLVTMTLGTWASGGFVSDGGVTGGYELGIPDACLASGAEWVEIQVYGATNMLPVLLFVELDALNYQDGVRAGLTALPNAAAGANGGLPLGDASARVLLQPTQTGVTIPTVTTLTNAPPDSSGVASLLARLTAARAGYLDNLNVGGAVASHADVLAINTSSSKHIILTTVGQYERPESGNTVYTVEARTYSAADGSAVNADTTPTLTATGQTSGSLAPNLGAATNPATGVYRWTYTVANNATTEPIRFDVSATIAAVTYTLSAYTQVVDEVSQTWTATDASHLTAIYNKLPANNIADETLVLNAISEIPTAPTAVAIRSEMDANSTKLASIDGKTANLPPDPADASDLAALINALPTAAENAGALLDLVDGVEVGLTPRQALRLIAAAEAGKISGAETTTIVIRNAVVDSKPRITATVDADGNRSAITVDLT